MSPDMPVPHKVCPQCGSQYQPWVERCVDCETPLVTPEEAAARGAGGRGHDEGEWEDGGGEDGFREMVLVRSEKVAWIRRLASELSEAGIPFHIEPGKGGHEPSLALYVEPDDLEDARRLDDAIYRREVLGAGAGDAPAARSARPARPARPAPADSATKVCPSCGGEYQAWAETCADCGVPLVASGAEWEGDAEDDEDWDEAEEGGDARTAEGADAADPVSRCPACGTRLPPNPHECPECGLGLGPVDEP